MMTLPLLADSNILKLERIVPESEQVTLLICSIQAASRCPGCGLLSTHIHSRYQRFPRDFPWQGVPVMLKLGVRKFFCRNPSCERRIFCERLENILTTYARQTLRLVETIEALGFGLGGEAGARTARLLGIVSSADTLLRRVRQRSTPAVEAPRVIGVDDWAYRKGARYGTLIVDLERRVPIELLPDRKADTLTTWLKAHPGTEVIARDRASAYADAAHRGAPQAVQVADRWHLLKNLQEAAQRFLTRQSNLLKQASNRLREAQGEAVPFARGSLLASVEPKQRQENRVRREQLRQEMLRLRQQGLSQRRIAGELGVSRSRVVAYLREGVPDRTRVQRGSRLDPYLPYLHRRWLEGCQIATHLFLEVKARGYPGGRGMVRRYIKNLRKRLGSMTAEEQRRFLETTARFKAPSVRKAAWWLLQGEEDLDVNRQLFLEKLVQLCPEAQTFRRLGLAFKRMVRERDADALSGWLGEAEASGVQELKGFALGIRQDVAAVKAALHYKWSNGQTEGQINRLKLLNRQMFGRANFDLLRARVLHAT